jgi:HSP20 family protein
MMFFGPSWSTSEMERALDDLGRWYGRSRRGPADAMTPLNVWANEEAVAVTVEVPGIDPDSMSISIVGDTLTVGGKRITREAQKVTWLRQERGAYEFSRTIQLPFRVDPEGTEARIKDGVLTIALRRVESDKPRKIAVKAA